MIGIFDSGFGGLTICKEILKQLPGNDMVFYADIVNFPYGNKSQEELRSFSKKIIEFLIGKGADQIVVACNTASTVFDQEFRDEFDIEIIDVINSGVKTLGEMEMDCVGLIATEATIKSGILQAKIEDKGPRVIAQPAPELVDLAQSMETGPGAEKLVEESLRIFQDKGIDGLYLGCTHYSLIKDLIRDKLDSFLIDPAENTVSDLKKYYKALDKKANLYFYSSLNEDENKIAVEKILEPMEVVVR